MEADASGNPHAVYDLLDKIGKSLPLYSSRFSWPGKYRKLRSSLVGELPGIVRFASQDRDRMLKFQFA